MLLYSSYEVCGILLEEYKRRQECVNSNTAFVSQGPFKGKKPPFKKGSNKLAQDQSKAVCHNCGKPRHYIRDCWSKGDGKEGQGPKRLKTPRLTNPRVLTKLPKSMNLLLTTLTSRTQPSMMQCTLALVLLIG